MARRNVVLVIALFIVLTLSACGGKPTPDVQAIETQTAAKIFATQTASVPTQTEYTPTDAAPAIDVWPQGCRSPGCATAIRQGDSRSGIRRAGKLGFPTWRHQETARISIPLTPQQLSA